MLIAFSAAIFTNWSRSPGHNWQNDNSLVDVTGVALLLLYLFFDAITSVWQDRIYRQYGRNKVDVCQMMLGVNVWAMSFTTVHLLLSGDLAVSLKFIHQQQDWRVVVYLFAIAKISALGQFLIFGIIREFGPVAFFTIILAIRKICWTTLTNVLHGHFFAGHPFAALAAVLVVSVVSFQIYHEYKTCQNRSPIAGEGGDLPII